MATQTHTGILKATPPAPAVPSGKQVTPPVTPLEAIAGKVADAIKANGAAPLVATPPEDINVPTAEKPAKTRDLDKLKNIFIHVENDTALKEAIAKAADAAQISLAAWCKVVIAEKLGVAIEAPVKTPKTIAEKAVAKADGKLTLMLLVRNHMRKLHGDDSAKAKAEQAKVDAYVKKLSELEGVGADKAKAILEATEKATS